MTSIFYSGLSKDLSLIFSDADDYNVIIQVGENQNTKEFRAHSVILRARSPYFKSAFSSDWITKKDNMIIFIKPNITPTVFNMILKYIYTGEIYLTMQSSEDILELLVASDELLIEELFNYIQDYLIENQATWIQENFVHVLHTVFKLSSCKKLQNYCLESICADPQPLISSKDFPSLDNDILYDLFKREDLQIEEVVAWDCLIKWGIEQTPGLENGNNDKTKWNDQDYESLKKTLNKFIPLIRYVEIPSADYFDQVRPYKSIIPNHIYEEVEEFYFKGTFPKKTTLPPRIGKSHIDSKIIKPRFISKITNLIDKKDTKSIRNKNDPIYKFNLVYRGNNQDGIDINLIRNKCKLQEPILVLIKCENKIFGGYTSIGFYNNNNNYWIYSTDNFIFSFENNDFLNMKLSRVTSYDGAIYNNCCEGDYGFNFGGNALYIKNQNLYANNENGYYECNLDSDETYIMEKIEIFKISYHTLFNI